MSDEKDIEKRFKEAAKSLKEMEAEIGPLTKKTEIIEPNRSAAWRNAENLKPIPGTSELSFKNDLRKAFRPSE